MRVCNKFYFSMLFNLISIFMRRLFLFLFFFSSYLGQSQNFSDSWTGYFSFSSVRSISQGNDRIYAATENAVFSYDLSTQEIKTITTINGLSGETISTLYYSENFNLLVIGYDTGLIEIVLDGDENVLKVVDILDKPTIPPNKKRINQLYEYNDNLYISTQYGISVYRLATLEFGDTYYIGDIGAQINISQVTVREPYIYAATLDNGVRRALVAADNLIDYQQWTNIAPGFYLGIQTLLDEVYTINLNNTILRVPENGPFTPVGNLNGPLVDFNVKNDVLTISTQNTTKAYGPGFVQLAAVNQVTGFPSVRQAGYSFENNFYLGTAEDGMLIVPFGSTQATQILPDGPLRNDPFAIDASPGQLWVSYGEVDVTYNPFFPNGVLSRRGISNLREGAWTNIKYNELVNDVNNEITDIVNVKINPQNADETYMTSFHNGLLKIEGQMPSILYNETNSPLEIPGGNPDLGIRMLGMDFDRQGNLWTVQTYEDNGLIKLSPNGQFQKIDITSVVPPNSELALTDLAISRDGNVFFGGYRSGVIGYNTQTGELNKIDEGTGAGNLPSANIRSLAFDSQNRLWIGTQKGLRVLFSPNSIFDPDANSDSQAIIILENGVAQELLFQQSITRIVVDGSNNKWIATATSGVFYLSSNGQETLLRFTQDNSPLPTNNVQDIAIDSFTGAVFFATRKGLVAYNGTATAPRENLQDVYVFPNPVRPGFNGNVTIDGLTAKANVKITDIEGNLVFESTSQGGSLLWDTRAFGRYKVASGVYLVLITTDDAIETKVSKIMIVR